MKSKVALCCVLIAVFLFAEIASSQPSSIVPFDAEKAKAAAQIQDPEKATQAYLDSVPKERRDKTKAYAKGDYTLDIVDFVFTSIILIAFLAWGISVRYRNIARKVTDVRFLQTILYWILFLLTITVIQFPLVLYR